MITFIPFVLKFDANFTVETTVATILPILNETTSLLGSNATSLVFNETLKNTTSVVTSFASASSEYFK